MWINEGRYRRLLGWIFALLGRKLVIINIDYMGLGNRLKLMASYHANYGLGGATLYWNTQGWVSAPFGALFEWRGPRFKEVPIRLKSWMVPIICHPQKDRWWSQGYWRFDVDPGVGEQYRIERWGKSFEAIDFLYERTPEPYFSSYASFFAQLAPSPAVQRRIDGLRLPPGTVGVQLRISDDPKDQARFPSMQAYLDAMHAEGPDATFYISAMNAQVADAIRQVFGERVLELPDKDYKSMVDATADLYLMGACERLLVSDGSTFGEVAWWLGGARGPVLELKAGT